MMAPRENSKTKFLGTRVTENSHKLFNEKASRYGVPSDVLRELIDAFIEDRLQIAPPVTSKKELLYVTRKQD